MLLSNYSFYFFILFFLGWLYYAQWALMVKDYGEEALLWNNSLIDTHEKLVLTILSTKYQDHIRTCIMPIGNSVS